MDANFNKFGLHTPINPFFYFSQNPHKTSPTHYILTFILQHQQELLVFGDVVLTWLCIFNLNSSAKYLIRIVNEQNIQISFPLKLLWCMRVCSRMHSLISHSGNVKYLHRTWKWFSKGFKYSWNNIVLQVYENSKLCLKRFLKVISLFWEWIFVCVRTLNCSRKTEIQTLA